MVSLMSSKKVWWVCALRHEWRAPVANRTKQGSGCPVCTGRTVLVGYNDLATKSPALAAQWHPRKNGSLTPEMVLAGTHKKVWWVCAFGHEWATSVKDRATGRGCPRCARSGFDQASPAVLYFLFHPELTSRKVGITNVTGQRLSGFVGRGWVILYTVSSQDGNLILAVEASVLSWIRKDLGLPPHLGPRETGNRGGWSETFSSDGPSDAEVIERINSTLAELALRRSDQLAASLLLP
jgi:Probable Zinc-ribbon domain